MLNNVSRSLIESFKKNMVSIFCPSTLKKNNKRLENEIIGNKKAFNILESCLGVGNWDGVVQVLDDGIDTSKLFEEARERVDTLKVLLNIKAAMDKGFDYTTARTRYETAGMVSGYNDNSMDLKTNSLPVGSVVSALKDAISRKAISNDYKPAPLAR